MNAIPLFYSSKALGLILCTKVKWSVDSDFNLPQAFLCVCLGQHTHLPPVSVPDIEMSFLSLKDSNHKRHTSTVMDLSLKYLAL